MIELMNVGVSFDGQRVLDGVTHAFAPGSATVVSGPSGSGKTTLLRCILGLTRPDEGAVRGAPERIGAVFQEDRLIERIGARANVRLVCGRGVSDARIAAELADVGIEEPEGKHVREFSGGMRRRVALVRALIGEPELIVLDEPFKGLDELSKRRAADYVRRHRGAATLILVTHDMAEAELVGANEALHLAAQPHRAHS